MEILIILLLLIKHYVVDFLLQTDEMVKGKGVYGNPKGILHSLQHAIGTLLIAFFFLAHPSMWLILPLIDFVTHYHIDWIKMNYGNRDITTHEFWSHLGLDQLAHQIVYVYMVTII